MLKSVYPCLWFDNQAKDAATFYCSVFNNSKIIADTPMVVKTEIEGVVIMGLNGGPVYTINPSISLFFTTESTEEIENICEKLLDGGSALMNLDKYDWSEKYAWVKDKFGMTWQLMWGVVPEGGQKIMPSLLFVGEQYGNAEQAIRYYTSIFPVSQIITLQIYQPREWQPEGKLKFGQFSLNNQLFTAMDGIGGHDFHFNEAVSFVVECETQEEIDHYWNHLTQGGMEVQCGWLKDKFGVSWQIVPAILSALMSDPSKAGKVTQAFMKMKKMDIETLIKAANS